MVSLEYVGGEDRELGSVSARRLFVALRLSCSDASRFILDLLGLEDDAFGLYSWSIIDNRMASRS